MAAVNYMNRASDSYIELPYDKGDVCVPLCAQRRSAERGKKKEGSFWAFALVRKKSLGSRSALSQRRACF